MVFKNIEKLIFSQSLSNFLQGMEFCKFPVLLTFRRLDFDF